MKHLHYCVGPYQSRGVIGGPSVKYGVGTGGSWVWRWGRWQSREVSSSNWRPEECCCSHWVGENCNLTKHCFWVRLEGGPTMTPASKIVFLQIAMQWARPLSIFSICLRKNSVSNQRCVCAETSQGSKLCHKIIGIQILTLLRFPCRGLL